MDKLENRQTKDRIADMLRSEILSGRLADRRELAQEQLAEALEVSRMPVREAMQILELEGLLLRLPNRHMQVIGPNENTVYENMRIVAAVEAEIALILMENNTWPDNIEIYDDRQFHNWFSLQLNNPYLRQVHMRLLAGYPQYVWDACKNIDRFKEWNKKILSALNDKDADSVSKSIKAYYRKLAQTLLYHINEERHE